MVAGPAERPDVVVSGDARGFYDLVVERDLDAVETRGSRQVLRAFLATLPPIVAHPARAPEPARRLASQQRAQELVERLAVREGLVAAQGMRWQHGLAEQAARGARTARA